MLEGFGARRLAVIGGKGFGRRHVCGGFSSVRGAVGEDALT
jgi:hypothetical protein